MEYKILGKKNLTPVTLKTMSNEERLQQDTYDGIG